MNNERKSEIEKLIGDFEELKSRLETIRDAETEYHDNVPDNLQSGERWERSESAVSALDSAVDSMESAIDELNSIE